MVFKSFRFQVLLRLLVLAGTLLAAAMVLGMAAFDYLDSRLRSHT